MLSNKVRKDWDYYTIMNVKEFLNTLGFYKNKQQAEAAAIQEMQDANR